MKRVISLVLCLMLVLSLTTVAFAEEHSHTITIHNSNAGYTYEAYQIFAGTLGSNGVLSDISWGTGVNGDALLSDLQSKLPAYASCTDAKQVAAALAQNDTMDDPDVVAFAELVRMHLTGIKVESTWDSATQKYTISGLNDGYYFVNNPGVPDTPNTTHSRYILEVVRDVAVTHKGTYPSVEKDIIEEQVEKKVNEASIGEAVNYQIVGTLPSRLDYYSTYYYAFSDTLSKGLTFNNDVTVTVNGVDVTKYFYVGTEPYAGTDTNDKYVGGTSLTVGIQDLLALELLEDPSVGDINKDTQVILTYSATVNDNAKVAMEGNPNKVKLVYDNNPNKDGEGSVKPPENPSEPTPPSTIGETPESEVETYTTELTIQKKDGAGKVLAGAEFTLSGDSVISTIVTRKDFALAEEGVTATHWELKDGTFTSVAPVFDNPETTDANEDTSHGYKEPGTADAPASATHYLKETKETINKTEGVEVKAEVGPDGLVTFTGLGAGTYTLTESKTPDGFNTINPITFKVEFNPTTKKFTADNNLILEEADNTLFTEIINVAGTTLPSTGGMGTTLFYIFGGIMVAGAAVLLITKKRMGAES